MATVPEPAPPPQPEVLYLAVTPSRPTCPRRSFATVNEALAWGREMSVFYRACFAVFRVKGPALTLEKLLPPPRHGEASQ
jgi:hypothetical protein